MGIRRAALCLGLVACAAAAPRQPIVVVGHPSLPPPTPVVCAAAPVPDFEAEADTVSPRDEPYSEDPKIRACEVTTKTLEAAVAEVLALPAPSGAARSITPWDHKTAPIGLDKVTRRFALTASELAQLNRDGVVVPARIAVGDWAESLHEVWQSELPLWVSADAIFHAVYASNDRLIARIEETSLAPRTTAALAAMHCHLATAAWPKDVLHDVDLYLTIARSLLAGAPVASVTGVDAEAAKVVALLEKAEGLDILEIFGRSRKVDFSQYLPRGHYTTDALKPYFRAAMFLSRFELNLVSRSSRSSADTPVPDPRETPRELLDAFALAELADVEDLDRAWRVIAGKREDISALELKRLRVKANVRSLSEPDAFERLKAAIGNDFRRTARLHPMPEGSIELPAIATLIGARVTPDTFATRPLVHSEIPDRHMIGPMDVAFMLGHDRAREYLKPDLAKFPTLNAQLAIARTRTAAPTTGEDMYGPWLTAVRSLATPHETAPSFTRTTAFADLRIDGAIAAYSQLRHNNVLVVGQGYDEGGCEIPDAFVDPAPEVYDALAEYARRGRKLAEIADPEGKLRVVGYFERLERTLGVLSRIARWELLGQPIPDAAKHWLSLVVELRPYGGTGGPPSFTGWWFDLFRLRQEGLTSSGLIADVFTSTEDESILYLGARAPRMAVFVVDTGGAPRVMVGPVARGFSHVGPLGKRLTDADADKTEAFAPWEASYTAPASAPPPLEIRGSYPSEAREKPPQRLTFELRSRAPLAVTLEALDHHRLTYASQTATVGTTWTKVTVPFAPRKDEEIDGLRIRAGGAVIELPRPHQAWTDDQPLAIDHKFGGI